VVSWCCLFIVYLFIYLFIYFHFHHSNQIVVIATAIWKCQPSASVYFFASPQTFSPDCFPRPVGLRIAEFVAHASVGNSMSTFKSDPMTWGVTGAGDKRLTTYSFGDYKSKPRYKGEVKLSAYLNGWSQPRIPGGSAPFAIATLVAAAGTGKSRVLDDAVRGDIAAELGDDGEVIRRFDPVGKLLLAISFNGFTRQECAFPVASRCVLEFFCGQPNECNDAPAGISANDLLKKIDDQLALLVPGVSGPCCRALGPRGAVF
jgi:hypothetical protein